MLSKGITYNMIRDPEKFLEFNMREYSNRWKKQNVRPTAGRSLG